MQQVLPPAMNMQQWETLVNVCTVLLPFEQHSQQSGIESDENLIQFKADLKLWLHKLPRPTLIRLLKFLNLLQSSWVQVIGLKNFTRTNTKQKEAVLLDFANSSIPNLRQGFQAIKRISMLLYYGNLQTETRKYYREWIQYPELASDIPKNRLETVKQVAQPDYYYDAVIIGSGVGGGIVAKNLAEAGLRVLIVEKGGDANVANLTGVEHKMIDQLYDENGNRSNQDNSLLVLAGNCLGGGSTINWQACINPPEDVLGQWANETKINFFTKSDFQENLRKAHRFFRSGAISEHNIHNKMLLEGCENAGYEARNVLNNIAFEKDQQAQFSINGFTGFGDVSGIKQTTVKRGLIPAVKNHAHVICDTRAIRILYRNRKVYGVILEKNNRKFLVECKVAVSCAGAIHTPALLKRSGLEHRQIGENLYLHPVSPVAAIYPHQVKGWSGPPLTSVCTHFSRLNEYYGCLIETPPLHPGFLALAYPWKSSIQHADVMQQAANIGAFIVLARDKYPGRLKFTKSGEPLIDYQIHDFDLNHILHGMAKAGRIHFGAGAKSVHFLHQQAEAISDKNTHLEQYIHKLSWAANRFCLYSAHQMGTCRMSGINAHGPVTPDGMTREVENLYVADASLFPSASGVNPMITIGALAFHVADQITARHVA